MSIHPLVTVAWEFHDLVRPQRARETVRDRCRAYLDARNRNPERPVPEDLLCEAWDAPDEREALTLVEKYALLAALCDEICIGEEKLGPTTRQEYCVGEQELGADLLDELTNAMAWQVFRLTPRKWLQPGYPDDFSQHARSWLADVRADLQAIHSLANDLQAPGVPAATTAADAKNVPAKASNTSATNVDGLKQLTPAVRQAWLSFQLAETKAEKRLEDREAYDWLKENGIPPNEGDPGELVDYTLPAFDTWSKYLRVARLKLGESKYRRRGRRSMGKSIVRGNQIESSKGEGK